MQFFIDLSNIGYNFIVDIFTSVINFFNNNVYISITTLINRMPFGHIIKDLCYSIRDFVDVVFNLQMPLYQFLLQNLTFILCTAIIIYFSNLIK